MQIPIAFVVKTVPIYFNLQKSQSLRLKMVVTVKSLTNLMIYSFSFDVFQCKYK